MGEIGPDRFIPCVVPPEYVNSWEWNKKESILVYKFHFNTLSEFFVFVGLPLINVLFWLVHNPLMVKLKATQSHKVSYKEQIGFKTLAKTSNM